MGPIQDNSLIDFLSEKLVEPDHDAFNYRKIAKIIAQTIRQASPPFVYAICGSWGTGKSSLLRLLVPQLPSAQEGGAKVYVNAWRSRIHKDILAKLVFSWKEQLEESEVLKKRSVDVTQLKETLKILADASVEALSDLNVATRILSRVYRKARKHQLEAFKSILESEERVREHFDILSDQLNKAGITVYVIIDELDRCAPTDVVRVIEALRMVFCGPDELELTFNPSISAAIPFKFFLSIDPDYVANAFGQHYGLSMLEANSYVSKFISYRYHFHTRQWKCFTANILDKFAENKKWLPEAKEDMSRLLSILELRSPRQARRILVYLLMWQRQHYGQVPGSAKIENLIRDKTQELGDAGVKVARAALRLSNLTLTQFAFVVTQLPSEANRLSHYGIFSKLPLIQKENANASAIALLFETEEIRHTNGEMTQQCGSQNVDVVARHIFETLAISDDIVKALPEDLRQEARKLAVICVERMFQT